MKYDEIPNRQRIDKVLEALKGRNIEPHLAENRNEALAKLRAMIPAGAELNIALSETLAEIGFMELLKSGKHEWVTPGPAIRAEVDVAKRLALRKQLTLAPYAIGSVHAVTEAGEVLVASGSGSQLPGFAFTADNVIWVVGAQKVVKDLAEGLRRIEEHSLPLEDRRMKAAGYPGSALCKTLIVTREGSAHRKVRLILVNEVLGY